LDRLDENFLGRAERYTAHEIDGGGLSHIQDAEWINDSDCTIASIPEYNVSTA
jgi:hypothetical protein